MAGQVTDQTLGFIKRVMREQLGVDSGRVLRFQDCWV